MRLRAVLFDLDGTLLDTLDDLADSMNAALAAMGCPAHPPAAYRCFVGDGMASLAGRVLPPERRDDDTVARAVAAMRDEYSLRWADKTRPYEGVPEMLDELAARGVILTVLSNKPDDFTRACVARLLPRWSFRAVLGAGGRVPVKPDPRGALLAAELAGVPPAGFLYLGDTNTDMQTALAAGMYPVGALWGFRTADELRQAGAAVLVARPQDVCSLL